MGRLTSLPSAVITDDSALGGAVIQRSLRFNDDDTAYLSRTPSSAGNRKTFTLSVWVKRGNLGTDQAIIDAQNSSGNQATIRFSSEGGSDSKINVFYYNGSSFVYRVHTTAELRDPSAWYHLVIAFDTTQATASNRIKIYKNGVQLTDMGSSSYPSQNYDTPFNNTILHTIGRNGTASNYFDGYIAELNFIDGLALDPSSFGYTDFQTETWRPKSYSGSYGTNGFRLPFINTGSFIDFFDESNSKHFFTRNGDVIHKSDQKKNGATSIYFDGSGDTLHTVDSTDFTFGTNDFTIEAYVRRTRQNADEWFVIQSDGTSSNTSIGLHFWASGTSYPNRATLRYRIGSTNYDANGTTVTVANTWYHIAGVRQGNTFRLYLNGVQEGTSTQSGSINDPTTPFVIGAVNAGGSAGLNGYMDQVRVSNVCRYPDGTSFTPPTAQFTSDSNTKLLLQSNVALNTSLGSDASGQGNDFTPNNLKSSDSLIDTPSNNFATLKTIGTPAITTMGEGNLYFQSGTTGNGRATRATAFATQFVNSGKWYCEHYHLYVHTMIGAAPAQIMIPYTSNNSRYIMVYNDGSKYVNTNGSESSSTYATNFAANNITGVLIDMDQTVPVMYMSYNGQWANGSGAWNQSNPYTSGGAIPMNNTFFTTDVDKAFEGYCTFWCARAGGSNIQLIFNFGQDSTFAGRTSAGTYSDSANIGSFKYPVPDGALALCSNNLSRLDNQRNTTSLINPKKHFGVVTWSGNSSTSNRKISGLEFQPDLVWTKTRNEAYHHVWMDSVRGPNNRLNSDEDFAENHTNGGYLASFDDGGFTWQYGGGSSNEWWNIAKNYAAFCWKAGGTAASNSAGTITSSVSANQEAGFSVVTFTGTGSAGTIGHGLGKAPAVVITKKRNGSQAWFVHHKGISNGHYLKLNDNNAQGGDTNVYPNNMSTTNTFGVGGDDGINGNNNTYVSYCWTDIEGYSSFGTYEGNGNANGPYVRLGFRPACLIIKSYSNSGNSYNWFMCDSTRGPYNNIYQRFQPNTAALEVTDSSNAATLDFLSDGFKLRGTGSMLNGDTINYVYMAWSEQSSNTPYASEPNAR